MIAIRAVAAALRRLMALTHEPAVLQDTGRAFAEVAQSRGIPLDKAVNPKQRKVR